LDLLIFIEHHHPMQWNLTGQYFHKAFLLQKLKSWDCMAVLKKPLGQRITTKCLCVFRINCLSDLSSYENGSTKHTDIPVMDKRLHFRYLNPARKDIFSKPALPNN